MLCLTLCTHHSFLSNNSVMLDAIFYDTTNCYMNINNQVIKKDKGINIQNSGHCCFKQILLPLHQLTMKCGQFSQHAKKKTKLPR
mmetsp:Transcript_24209/g.50198  ORF Transcript_24209/g.50198 Transcript_24209/m.50198 type:complete len:85 (-) Transcript_24209:102-356(-)